MKLTAILLVACSTFAASPAIAVERGCKAKIYMVKGDDSHTLDAYNARATAGSANRARERASAKARDCAWKAREFRWQHRIPDHCKPGVGIDGYEMFSIKTDIERWACFQGYPKGTWQIRVSVSGDKGCSANDLLMNYDIEPSMCKRLGAWDIRHDRPGSDYVNFPLSQFNPGQCQAACDKDSKCKAWTYVGPQPGGVATPGRSPHCWLKTTTPRQKVSSCCVSGVKGVEGHTDRPGGDYKTVRLDDTDPALCKAACDKEDRCRAWTLVSANEPNLPTGNCWLKDSVPPARYRWGGWSGLK